MYILITCSVKKQNQKTNPYNIVKGNYHYPQFTDAKTEAQRFKSFVRALKASAAGRAQIRSDPPGSEEEDKVWGRRALALGVGWGQRAGPWTGETPAPGEGECRRHHQRCWSEGGSQSSEMETNR